MTEINTREIATTLMLDAAREVPLVKVWATLAARGCATQAERELRGEEVDELMDRATITIAMPGVPPLLPPKWSEWIARNFHEAYETLAPKHGYETRKASAVPWEDVPANNRNLMIATVGRLLEQGIIAPGSIDRREDVERRIEGQP